MKKITHFSIALCLLTAGVVVAQSNMSIDAIAERMNDRLDAFDPERRTAIACERVAQTDRSLVDAQTAYLRAGAEQFVAARNQALGSGPIKSLAQAASH